MATYAEFPAPTWLKVTSGRYPILRPASCSSRDMACSNLDGHGDESDAEAIPDPRSDTKRARGRARRAAVGTATPGLDNRHVRVAGKHAESLEDRWCPVIAVATVSSSRARPLLRRRPRTFARRRARTEAYTQHNGYAWTRAMPQLEGSSNPCALEARFQGRDGPHLAFSGSKRNGRPCSSR